MTALSRTSDPATSREAAAFVDSHGIADAQRAKCLDVVREHPNLTAAEIAIIAGLDRYAASRRLPELRPRFVTNGPARICTVKGRSAMTWEAVRP